MSFLIRYGASLYVRDLMIIAQILLLLIMSKSSPITNKAKTSKDEIIQNIKTFLDLDDTS